MNDMRAGTNAFLKELRRLGAEKVGIYAGHHLYNSFNLNLSEADAVWIPHYGKNDGTINSKPLSSTNSTKKSLDAMAKEIIDGKHDKGYETRRKSLGITKTEYDKVKKEVNKRLTSNQSKSIKQMADEVYKGLHGNGHEAFRKSLGISKEKYEKVKKEVNKRFK